jgi:glutathione peroxidase
MKFYNLEAKKPNGEIIDFSQFKGKTMLIVNTATECGLTPQFKGLEELHKKYRSDNFVVLGFPCNQFKNQEPQTNDTMEEICKINHGVSFQLTEKVDVNGENTHEVFKFLKSELKGILGNKIKWNFTKFLIDKEGNPYKRYAPITVPSKIEKDIIKLI